MRPTVEVEQLLHPASLQRLHSAVLLKHHAYLVEGDSGLGTEQVAMWILQQQDAALTKAEVAKVVPATSTVSIAQVRELIEHLWRTPARVDGIRAGIVMQADRMSTEAANALLKVLEEPPSRVVIVLVASSAEQLPSTVRSRVLTIPLLPLGDQQIQEFMQAYGGATPELVGLSHGLPLQALELASSSEELESRQLEQQKVDNFLTGTTSDRFVAIAEITKSGSPEQFVLGLLYTFGKKFSILERSADVEVTLWCLRAIRAHVQPKLALEWLALKLS